MQKHTELTKRRLEQYKNPLYGKIYTDSYPVKLSAYAAPDRIRYEEAMQGDYAPIEVGHKFGPLWSTFWVRVELEIPEAWAGKEVHFLWDSMSEAEVWVDGKAMQGLTGSTINSPDEAIRKEFILTKNAQGGQKQTLYVEVACNHLFGVMGGGAEVEYVVGKLRDARLALFDRDAWDLYWDFVIVADMALYLDEGTPRQGQAMRVADNMIDMLRLDRKETWAPARALAAEFLSEHNGDSQHNLSAVGNAHIDTAWLWPLEETKRKCVRTFSSAVRYMDEYPEYIFTVSQAQQLEWIKDEQPELYARLKEKFEAGQFIPTGGSWVEPDCNIPNGESFVRQFLFGQRFFEKEFNFHCVDFWEPDVFGYSAALPQILKQAEIDYFLTQKLSWNQFNKISTHTFMWEGLDGSQVLTHFPPVNSYSALANVRDVVNNSKRYKDHENSKESYMLFGHGDGGGGPTMGMIEQVKRMNDVDGLARVEIRDPKTFYKRLEDDLIDPVKWVGELYLEYHRGTYTTQAATKKNNRLGEFLLHDIEFLSALAAHKGESYPMESLDWMWKSLLKNQFHDIIPGSSITMVYEDADNEYAKLLAHGAELRSEAVDALFCTDGDKVLAVNTTSFDREEVVALPEGTPSAQVSACGKPLGLVSAPAYGYAVVEASENAAKQVSFSETDDRYVFENDNLKAVFTKAGAMVSLFEKNVVREAIASGGKGNQFVIFEDRPCQWDAWDVDIYHLGTREEVPGAFRTAVLETGPFRASVEFEYQISETSSIKQVVSLSAASQHVDFDNQVEWHEEHRFLKVEFPFTVRSSEAAYEIQFGHLRRPTHFNTSWDMARFEVVGHKWADLSEYGFGVALLNDCKYGYSTLDNVMRLSLLRSPKNPDPVADMGSHSFKYAVMPHGGTFQQAGVIGAGYCFNAPLLVSKTGADVEARSFFGLDSSAVVIDTIKRAEDSDAFIVRMYESYGSNVDVTLSTAFEVLEAAECNLLERQDQAVDMVDGKISMHFSPFQIRTLKLKVK